ncbi:response regulator transcription factor [Pseudobacter ginsenosidimutans]|uniref:DNA-binding NarL/FixJ family response regulator n=1 Tax=Pseudobacter ginsenosidimutans TaxID=661488 RepID=A0A4Q7N5C6_9BACT|nr:DNA-binding response regulator [Pseudobacter ginsenosidimutans]RZS76263.1 DNA-binding NarL/FixJ family response regulator [Pseudobacter ginsenosidimutans]
MIRVLIVEDEIIIARFIELQLLNNFDCETRVAISPKEAREAMPDMQPHLLLCDINLCDEITGIALVAELKNSYSFETIFITSYQNKNIIEQASATNPANYIIKPVDEAQLFAGIQLVMTKIGLQQPATKEKASQAIEQLNNTEFMILREIRNQKTTKEIAKALHLSPYTIKNHRHNICRKLDLEEGNNALLKWVMQNQHLLK